MTSKKMRIEALLAYPPTRKCKEILVMLQATVAADSENLRLDVYEAGSTCTVTPTLGYQKARGDKGKFKKIPCVLVNGKLISSGEVPSAELLQKAISVQLQQPREE